MLTNYPDIISMIVDNKIDMIDVSKLHGIKKKLLKVEVLVNKKLKLTLLKTL